MSLLVPLGNDKNHPIVSGDKLVFEGTVWADEAHTVPRDLSAVADFEMSIFDRDNPGEALVTVTKADGEITIVSAANGRVRYTFFNDKTVGLSGVYYYQAALVDTDGGRATVSVGHIKLTQGLSR